MVHFKEFRPTEIIFHKDSNNDSLQVINTKVVNEIHKTANDYKSLGNTELSLIGKRWYYYDVEGENINLNYDEIVDIDDDNVKINMYIAKDQGHELIYDVPFTISKENYLKMYPIQSIFSSPLSSNKEAFAAYFESATTSKSIY